MTQNQRILNHLEKYGTITPREARNIYGIERLSARISELRSRGYDIITNNIPTKNKYGEKTHYAEYRFNNRVEIK